MSDSFLDTIANELRRRDEGPICGLCTAIPEFTAADIPEFVPSKMDAKATIKHIRCPRVGLFVTPEYGQNCRRFERKPGV